MQLILVSGLSGSGKTVALRTLEDLGYVCIDNLPVRLLHPYLDEEIRSGTNIGRNIAIGIDVRAGESDLREIPQTIRELKDQGLDCQTIYLTADDDILLRRYNETRRTHPLGDRDGGLMAAIKEERRMLAPVAEFADLTVDTTHLNVHDLRQLLKSRLLYGEEQHTSLLFQSFGYKHGSPRDADFVFDVRCLPNPYWEESLRAYTGREKPVIEYLDASAETAEMLKDIIRFLEKWLPCFEGSDRSYLTVAIGCTGGRHRSVYIAERLGQHFAQRFERVAVRHSALSELIEAEQLSLLQAAARQ